MLKIRCKICCAEIEGSGVCGCPNMTSIKNDKILGKDLSLVEIISGLANYQNKTKPTTILSPEDIEWHRSRSNRKVKKLEFEIR